MKLDKIKFASLIGFISCRYALTVTQDDIAEMDQLIDIDVLEVAEPEKIYPLNSQVEQLMMHMAGDCPAGYKGSSKIEAIKFHRAISGYGLKESKDTVEKYWENGQEKLKQKMIENLSNGPNMMLEGLSSDQLEAVKKYIESF
jgi:hypothetical protein